MVGALFLSSCTLAQTSGDSIIGQWYTEGCKAKFDFYRCNNEYKARMIPLEESDMVDSNNPVDSLKKRKPKLNGATTIYGLQYDPKQRRWLKGKVYNPENGKTYSCYCALKKEGTLFFRGFVGMAILGGSQIWTREACKEKKE